MSEADNKLVAFEAEPGLLSHQNAARFLGISRSYLYKLIEDDLIGPTTIELGGKSLWRLADLRKWVDAGCPPRKEWEAKNESVSCHV